MCECMWTRRASGVLSTKCILYLSPIKCLYWKDVIDDVFRSVSYSLCLVLSCFQNASSGIALVSLETGVRKVRERER